MLKPLQDGMKSLLQLLSDAGGGSEEAADDSEGTSKLSRDFLESKVMPSPLSLDYFYSRLPIFTLISQPLRSSHKRRELIQSIKYDVSVLVYLCIRYIYIWIILLSLQK